MAGEAGNLAAPPYPRETGVLARVDEMGRELVLHQDSRGKWHAFEWRVDPIGRTICALKYGLTAEEWAACGQALSNVGLTCPPAM